MVTYSRDVHYFHVYALLQHRLVEIIQHPANEQYRQTS